MTSQKSDFENTMKSESQALGDVRQAPAAAQLPPLTKEQSRLLKDYRHGRMDEKRFQECLANDPILSDYVRKVCRPTDPSVKTH